MKNTSLLNPHVLDAERSRLLDNRSSFGGRREEESSVDGLRKQTQSREAVDAANLVGLRVDRVEAIAHPGELAEDPHAESIGISRNTRDCDCLEREELS